jgi:cytochrome c oxidase subunit III
MASYTPTAPIDQIGRAGDPPAPPVGGEDRGGGNGGPNYAARLRRARLGLVCLIATVCMIFISLTSAYVVRQGLPTYDDASKSYVRDWSAVGLPWTMLIFNTLILLASSGTMEAARRSSRRQIMVAQAEAIPGISTGRDASWPWLGITVVLGFGFLIGQWLAWGELHNRGFYVNTNPSSSFAFLLTITHAVHLAGGIVALLWAAMTSLAHRPVESRRIVIDITAWYWHFMALVWLYVFGLLAFAR